MSDYQLRAVDQDGEPFGVWHDVAGREKFWTGGNHVLIRKKPVPRGAGWYQYTRGHAAPVGRDDVHYCYSDPGEDYRKMNVESQEDAA